MDLIISKQVSPLSLGVVGCHRLCGYVHVCLCVLLMVLVCICMRTHVHVSCVYVCACVCEHVQDSYIKKA